MELQELIYKRLCDSPCITDCLTNYGGFPAVFVPEAPSDQASGWHGRSNYPRIVFNIDFAANSERKRQGSMILSLYCENNGKTDTAYLSNEIKRSLCSAVYAPENGGTYCIDWNRSDGFVVDGTNIFGSEMEFDLLELPCQRTTAPDPIDAVNCYIKRRFPELLVLWHDRVKDIEEIKDLRPVFYARLENSKDDSSRSSYSVAWMNCTIAGHLLCPDTAARTQYIRSIVNQLAADQRIIMLDQSPFAINHVSVGFGSDPLTAGQIRIEGAYGILRNLTGPASPMVQFNIDQRSR